MLIITPCQMYEMNWVTTVICYEAKVDIEKDTTYYDNITLYDFGVSNYALK